MLLSRPIRFHSLDNRLVAVDNRPSGFDYLRIILALCIIVFHSFETSYGFKSADAVYASHWRPLVAALLPMFFALSGFLVAGSLERSPNILSFLGLRALRILPALSVEVILSALVLGPLLTIFALHDYFSDPIFFSYFLNMIGDVHYYLPGLYQSNPVQGLVNAQLWTLPFELLCYCVLTVLAVLGFYKRPQLLLIAVMLVYALFLDKENTHTRPWVVSGETLLMTFLSGILLYRFRKHVPWNIPLFTAASVLSLYVLAVPSLDMLVALPLAYVTTFLGLLNPKRNKLILSGDYSYALFLYGYPLQQAVSSLNIAFREWYWNLAIALPFILALAVFSWWAVEKPALKLRRFLK